ncbi:MAG: TRIC cation channel family protein [Cumulibacter sp.]
MTLAELNEVTRWLDLAGAFACAILGGAVAREVGLDLVGHLVVGIASAPRAASLTCEVMDLVP